MAASGAPRADAFDDALGAFRRAARTTDIEQREAALAALVALADTKAHEPLREELARASMAVREGRDELRRMTAALERQRTLVRSLETRRASDESLADSVGRQQQELGRLEGEVRRVKERAKVDEPWLEVLRSGVRTFVDGLRPVERRKYGRAVWSGLDRSAPSLERLGTLEIAGALAGDGAIDNLLGFLSRTESARTSIKRKLAREKSTLDKAARKAQEKAGPDSNRSAEAAAQAAFRRKVEESRVLRQEAIQLAFEMDAASEAGGRVLSRLAGETLDAAVSAIAKTHQKSAGPLAQKSLAMLHHAGTLAVDEAVLGLLAEADADDVGLRRALLLALARPGSLPRAFDALVLELDSPHWQVRAAAIEALAARREVRSVPILIERLAHEEGRIASDLTSALNSLTGRSMRANHAAWERWWKSASEDFEVVALGALEEGSLSVEEEMGVSFFGIRTESRRVLFVLDVSGSMNFAMVPRNNPTDDPRFPADMPRENESSRLEVARQELVNALGGIRDGGLFNLVLYASDVWTWEDELVRMETAVRSDVLRFVDSLTAGGATNLHGALMRAFELAGVAEDADWSEPLVDTIYVLSDGKPSMGVLTVPEEILAAVRERNAAVGITIHTIGLSGAQDAGFLSSLALENGGQYVAR